MKLLNKEQSGYWIFINILGIKLRILKIKKLVSDFRTLKNDINKIKTLIQRSNYANQRLQVASIVNNKTFRNFKGINKDKTVVLVGAGPTVNYFEPIENAIYVGCNRAVLYDKVAFDYLFAIDKIGIREYYNDFFNYRNDSCLKFIGDQNLGINYQIPENNIPISNKVYRYITNAGIEEELPYIPLDISIFPLYNSCTVSIQAMQFILWTQPKKIYLVGIDCTSSNNEHFIGDSTDVSFRKENLKINDKNSINSYRLLKEFINTYYPYTQIISVNPIGLKGIFEDIYTNPYLNTNSKTKSQVKGEF